MTADGSGESGAAEARRLLDRLWRAALAAAEPRRAVTAALPQRPQGRIVVVGAGKASAAMARAVEEAWGEALTGLVITRYGHAVACRHIEIVEAAHPVPDAAGLNATRRILDLVSGCGADDLVLCLISGGGSSLLVQPAPGVDFADKQRVTAQLVRSGAAIDEINCVRKHLSAVKGGRLALAALPARVVSLIISDVPGDDPAVIASGPTAPDPTTFADARAVLRRHGMEPPASVAAHLAAAAEETLKPDDPRLAAVENRIIAAPQAMLEAAAAEARAAGLSTVILGDAIEGEAREVARALAGIARQVARHGQPAPAPAVLLSGGETTVTVRGRGRGGRNTEFALALAVALQGHPSVHAIACDTDGIDGTEDNAGALVGPSTLPRAAALGLDPRERLDANDSYAVLAALGDLVVSGPTYTNVNDFRAILVLPDGK